MEDRDFRPVRGRRDAGFGTPAVRDQAVVEEVPEIPVLTVRDQKAGPGVEHVDVGEREIVDVIVIHDGIDLLDPGDPADDGSAVPVAEGKRFDQTADLLPQDRRRDCRDLLDQVLIVHEIDPHTMQYALDQVIGDLQEPVRQISSVRRLARNTKRVEDLGRQHLILAPAVSADQQSDLRRDRHAMNLRCRRPPGQRRRSELDPADRVTIRQVGDFHPAEPAVRIPQNHPVVRRQVGEHAAGGCHPAHRRRSSPRYRGDRNKSGRRQDTIPGTVGEIAAGTLCERKVAEDCADGAERKGGVRRLHDHHGVLRHAERAGPEVFKVVNMDIRPQMGFCNVRRELEEVLLFTDLVGLLLMRRLWISLQVGVVVRLEPPADIDHVGVIHGRAHTRTHVPIRRVSVFQQRDADEFTD